MSDDAPMFGRLVTAMVTPFTADGSVNSGEAARLAQYLVDDMRNDALVVNGTTGESPTTTDDEKAEVIRAVVAAVGDRAKVLSGVGTASTTHSIELAHKAHQAGAHGVLLNAPYYSRPPREQLEAHLLAVADASQLPVMLYDIPHRTGVPIAEESFLRVAEHPKIVAVKDAKVDLASSAQVIASTGLHYYAGDDAALLPLLSVGAVGVVGTSTHFSGRFARAIIDAYCDGRNLDAVKLNAKILPVFRGVFATQGPMMVKAALNRTGWNVGACRAPLGEVPEPVLETFLTQLQAATQE